MPDGFYYDKVMNRVQYGTVFSYKMVQQIQQITSWRILADAKLHAAGWHRGPYSPVVLDTTMALIVQKYGWNLGGDPLNACRRRPGVANFRAQGHRVVVEWCRR